MKNSTRLRRCCLSVPGNSAKMLEKASSLACDQILLDLEDSVAPESKLGARKNISSALKNHTWQAPTLSLRINATDTEFCHDDIIQIVTQANENLDTIVISKTRSARDVEFVEILLAQLEKKLGLSKTIGIECLIEDVEGLMKVEEIAASSARLEALIFGMGDYAASQGMRIQTIGGGGTDFGDIWHYPRSKITIACKAYGLDAIDGPYADFNDLPYLESDCAKASILGMNGKWAIHPSQIEINQKAFSYTNLEVEKARAQLAAYQEAEKKGLGVVKLDNVMIDAASVKLIKNLLEKAELMKIY